MTQTLKSLKDLMARSFQGKTVEEAQEQAVCVACGKKVTGFRDAISNREYNISGMCQENQDSVFGD